MAWGEPTLELDYPFLVLDAMYLKIPRQRAVRPKTAMLAVGINEKGDREILRLETVLDVTEEAWHRFVCGLKERGLSGVDRATSDAHGDKS